jgi:hypothetical protein
VPFFPVLRLGVVPRVSILPFFLTLALAFCAECPSFAQRVAPRTTQFQPGQPLPLQVSGEIAGAFHAQQPRPLAMASADFDEDGVADLAIGYGLTKGGAIALMRGNLDAVAPESYQSWLDAGQGRYASPFLPKANTISVPEQPDFLRVADVNGDGHQDLVFAPRNGHALYVLLGDGKGHFALQPPVAVSGAITALAAYRPGDEHATDAVIVGLKSKSGSDAALFRASRYGLQRQATYPTPGDVSAIEIANLDSDLTPDAAIIADGQLLVLHGRDALKGAAQMETLPINSVQAVTAGEFLFDRHAQPQLSVLTADGTIHVLAHGGFDSRPYTREEIAAARRDAMLRWGAQSLAEKAGNTGDQPWTEIEHHPGVAPSSLASSVPLLLHSRSSSSGGEDIVVVNPSQEEIASIRHPASLPHTGLQASIAGPAIVSRSALNSGDVVAAISQRISPQGAEGLVMLRGGSVRPDISTPAPSNTLYVNTTADTLDANDALRCTNGSAETCSLRDAVTYANADSSTNVTDGTVDTIMVPAGTYNLTLNAGNTDSNGNGITHLEILGPVTMIGSTSGAGVRIDGNANDTIFTINPGLFGSFNPSGNSYIFDTTLENVIIQNGKNNNNLANSALANNVGGCINWDAFGAGNLTLTNSSVLNCTILWGAGGGIWAFNSGGGGGKLTVTGGVITDNSTPEEGGGIYGATGAAVTIQDTTLSSNSAKVSVNASDGGALGQGGGLFLNARTTTGVPQSTISGGAFNNNTSDSDGGGIYTNTGIAISGGTAFSGNSSGGSGGGIFDDTANAGFAETTTIAAANFTANSAVTTGGGITVGAQPAASGNLLTVGNSRFYGNTSTNGASGLSVGEPGVSGAGGVTAIENWWGCDGGPTAVDVCDKAVLYDAGSGTMTTDPHIVLTLGVSPNPVAVNNAVQLTASVNSDSSLNNPVSGQPGALQGLSVAFGVTVGGFSASPSSAITASGDATASVTPTSGGAGSATATLDGQTVTANFTVISPPATHFAVSAPSSATAGTSFSITVTALDASNAVAAGYSGTVHFTGTDGSATLPADATLTSGVGTFSVTLKTAGIQTITATDTASASITGTSGGITVAAAAATHYTVIAPANAVAGAAFSFTVTAKDQFNNTATGYGGTVHFTSSDGSATLPANSALTNGVGAFSATLKTAGAQAITATDAVTVSINGTSGAITVAAASATHFLVTATSPVTSYVSFSTVTVSALDAFGNTATIYAGTVRFTSTDPGAVTPADSTLTNGVGSFQVGFKTAGTQTVTVTDTVNALITGTSNSITVLPGPATRFVFSTPASTTVGNAFSFTVTALDLYGNKANSYAGAVHFTSTDPSATLPANATLTNGVGTFSATLITTGSQTIAATDTVNPAITGTSGAITVGSAEATHYSVAAPGSSIAGNAFSFTVTALDQFNNTATAYAGTVHFTSTDGNATLPVDATLTNGVGTFSATLKTEGGQTISAADTATASIVGTSAAISVSAASGTHFVITAPATATAGSAVGFTVTAEDQFNNIVTGFSDTLRFTSSDGNATLPADATLTNGVGSFSATLKTAGNQTVTATDTGNASVNGTSGTIAVAAASATHFAISAPATATAGTSFNLVVTAQDAFNNTAISYTGRAHFTSSDGNATLPADATLTNGVGAFAVTLKTEGTQTITATDTVTSTITGSSSMTVNPAASVHFVVVAPATATAGTAVNFAVTAEDQFDNTINGYAGTVHFTSSDGVATLPANMTLSNGTGTFSATFKTAGSQTIAATDTVTVSISGVSGGVTVSAGAATHYAVSTPATANSGVAFNFTVTAFDQFNNTAKGYSGTVHFTSSDGQATLPANSTLTSGTGTFSATLKTAGSQTITATDTVTNTITGTSAPISLSAGAAMHFVVSAPVSAALGTAFSFTVTAYDSANNVATGYAGAAHFTSTDATAALPANSTLVNGTGTFSATLNTAGSQTITATDMVSASIAGVSNVITVGKATPVVAWTPTTSIPYGTSLSALLTATATFNGSTLSGTFVYTATPTGGTASTVTATTELPTGSYVLAVTFTPANTGNYNTPLAVTSPLTVTTISLAVKANNATRIYGAANPSFTGTVTGAVNGDTFTESFITTATITSNVGTYPIVPGVMGMDLSDYMVNYTNGTLTVTQASTITSLSVSSTSITAGQSITLTAQVASATTGTPTGIVSFFDGATLLSTVPLSGGAASYSTTSLSSGTHTLTATYSGDVNFTASSPTSPTTVTVASLDFTVTISGPGSQTVFPGGTISYTVVVDPLYGNFAGAVSFTVDGLPAGATASFSPSTIAANGGKQTVTVTIQTVAAAAVQPSQSPGRAVIPLAFALLLLPIAGARRLRRQGRRLSRMICLFFAMGIVSATAAITGCGSTNGFFAKGPQSYSLTITATAGGLKHAATVTLKVE